MPGFVTRQLALLPMCAAFATSCGAKTREDASQPDTKEDAASSSPSLDEPAASEAASSPSSTMGAPAPPVVSPVSVAPPEVPGGCEAAYNAALKECVESASWVLDCDGDAVLSQAYLGCAAPITLEVYEGVDCDDMDPNSYRFAAPDSDGDGYGADVPESEWVCVGELPVGMVEVSWPDCDDNDPAVHPDAADVWGDGIDADCTGFDSPKCDVFTEIAGETPEGAALDVARVAPIDGCSDGFDLYVALPAICWRCCGGRVGNFVFVGNRGGAAFDGEVTLAWSNQRSGESVDVELGAFAPGQVSDVVGFSDEGNYEVRVVLREGDEVINDCDSTNDVVSFTQELCPCAR